MTSDETVPSCITPIGGFLVRLFLGLILITSFSLTACVVPSVELIISSTTGVVPSVRLIFSFNFLGFILILIDSGFVVGGLVSCILVICDSFIFFIKRSRSKSAIFLLSKIFILTWIFSLVLALVGSFNCSIAAGRATIIDSCIFGVFLILSLAKRAADIYEINR